MRENLIRLWTFCNTVPGFLMILWLSFHAYYKYAFVILYLNPPSIESRKESLFISAHLIFHCSCSRRICTLDKERQLEPVYCVYKLGIEVINFFLSVLTSIYDNSHFLYRETMRRCRSLLFTRPSPSFMRLCLRLISQVLTIFRNVINDMGWVTDPDLLIMQATQRTHLANHLSTVCPAFESWWESRCFTSVRHLPY